MCEGVSLRRRSLLFDLNGLKAREGTGPWQPDFNASALIAFIDSKYGGSSAVAKYAWSVGNGARARDGRSGFRRRTHDAAGTDTEPELWPISPHVSVPQLAADACTLKQLLSKFSVGSDVRE